jgi:hypothetical protein
MMTPNSEEQTPTPPEAAGDKSRVARRKAKPARKAKRGKLAVKAGKQAATARRGSKTAKALDLLKRPSGASLKELMKMTGWQPHSVRGFLSGTVRKKMGLPLESSQRQDQERSYSIRSK